MDGQLARLPAELPTIGIVKQTPGVEVKLARTVSDADVKHLLWLRAQLGDDVTALVVVTTGEHAYRRPDGVLVVPLGLFGP